MKLPPILGGGRVGMEAGKTVQPAHTLSLNGLVEFASTAIDPATLQVGAKSS